MNVSRRLFVLGISMGLFTGSAIVRAESTEAPHESTHKQTRVISPAHDGQPIALNTFCLDTEGNILACVGGDTVSYVPSADGSVDTKTVKAAKLVQKYSPEGKLLQEIELDFKPTAINVAADGSVFVAGLGRVAHLSKEGKVIVVADSPHLGDVEEMRAKATKAAEEQMKMMTGTLSSQVERVDEMIQKLKDKPEDELTERDRKRMESLSKQRELYAAQEKQMSETYSQFFSADNMLKRAMEITSLAVTSKDVFLCCGSIEGRGYEVWRTDHDLSSPKRVVESLGGCCGQCDIQANDDYLILAENTKFQVSLLDRDGEAVTSFGKRDRTSKDGFGSCCNPMNVRCCSNGDILTAESSVGYIKRYNKEGEFLGTVGKAKIGGGCKHVAIGHNEETDHYYMQYEDRNQICVLVPLSEAPEFTADELSAKQAREGLARRLLADGEKLSGEWSLDGKRSGKPAGGIFGAISSALGTNAEEDATDETEQAASVVSADQTVAYFHFFADGKLLLRGGYMDSGDNSWQAISQDKDANKVRISQLQDGVQYYDYEVEFIDDNQANISTLYGDQVIATNLYKRVPIKTAKPSAAKSGVAEEIKEVTTEEAATEEVTTKPAGQQS